MAEKTERVKAVPVARKKPGSSQSGRKRSRPAARPEGSRRSKRSKRRAILVLGMHRSGTSAITKLLGICGARLPRHPLAASELNTKGFFESDPIYRLHEELFEQMGTSWDDLAPPDDSWLASPIAEPYVERMASLVEEEFGDGQLIVIKDPRMCRLVPFWREVLDVLQIEPCFVLPIRDPLEVASSLKQAQGIPELKGLLLWLQYFLQAERDSRGDARSFLTYDRLLNDWRAVIKTLSRDLDLTFPRLSRRAGAEGDDFLTGALRNHTQPTGEFAAREDVVSWVKETYAWSQKAALKKPTSFRRLDQIWTAYCVAEAAFGPVVAHSQLAGEQRQHEARELLSEVTELKAEIGELQVQLVPQQQIDQLADKAHAKERQVADLVECIKLMLSWIASSTAGGQAAHERLDSLLQALNSADAGSISEIASQGLQRFEQSEMLRLQQETQTRASEVDTLASGLRHAEQQLALQNEQLTEQARQLAERTEQIERQAEQLADQDVRRAEYDQRIASLDGQLADLQAHVLLQDEQLQTARDRSAAQDQQLAAASEREVAQSSTLETLQSTEAERAERLTQLETETARLHSLVEEGSSRLRDADLRREQQGTEMLGLRSSVEEKDALLRDTLQRLEQQDSELLGLRSRIEDKDALLRAKTEEADRLLVERDQAQAQLDTRLSDLGDLEGKQREQETEVERQREELSLAHGEIQRLHGIATRVRRQDAEAETSRPPESPQPSSDSDADVQE